MYATDLRVQLFFLDVGLTGGKSVMFQKGMADPFRRFSTCVWQNACVNAVGRAMVCEVYFPFSKTL